MMYIRVRIKGILKNLVSNTNNEDFPIPLVMFINKICGEGRYVPDAFLTPYQLNRIDTDNYGAILSVDDTQVKMIASIYMWFRRILMNTEYACLRVWLAIVPLTRTTTTMKTRQNTPAMRKPFQVGSAHFLQL